MKLKQILLFTATFGIFLLLAGPAAAYANGTGTDSDPYQIETLQDLKDVSNDLTASYILTNDVDIDEGTWKTLGRDAGGNAEYRFTGVFDGNNFTITFTEDTEFKSDDHTGYGLFGAVTNDAELKNVKIVVNGNLTADSAGSQDRVGVLTGIGEGSSIIENCSVIMKDGFSISGNIYVGGLAGVFEGGTLSSSHFIGSVKGNNDVGGLVGFSKNSAVYSSYMTGNVEGTGSSAGGLVGSLGSVIIDSCYVSGDVEGNRNVGGIAGYMSDSTISDSYVLGNVTGTGSTGGLVGDLTFGGSSLIENCFSAAFVTGNQTGTDYVGGIVGALGYTGAGGVKDCFYVAGNVSGGDNGVGIAVDDVELMDILTFTSHADLGSSWSISSSPDPDYVWYISDGEYPKLCWEYVEPDEAPAEDTVKKSGGSGFGSATVVDSLVNGFGNSTGGSNSGGGSIILPEESEHDGYENPVENVSHGQPWLLLLLGVIVVVGIIGYIIVKKETVKKNKE